MTNHSGKLGTGTVGGTEVPLVNWNVQATSGFVEFINSKTGGFVGGEATFKRCRVSFGIDFDFDANPFAAPTAITVGATIANVKLYLNGTAGLFWNFPSFVVTELPQTLEVDGRIVTTVTGVANGTYAQPGAITPP